MTQKRLGRRNGSPPQKMPRRFQRTVLERRELKIRQPGKNIRNEWLLASNKHLDRLVAIIGGRVILSSLHHPSLNITFTVNWWAHIVAVLKDIDSAACLRPLQRKATGRRRI